MNATWVAEISKQHLPELAQLRLLPDVEMAETASSVWLRGETSLEEAQAALSHVPHVRLFHAESAGLRLQGNLLVSRTLPTQFGPARTTEVDERFLTVWQPMILGIPVDLPQTRYASGTVMAIAIRLVRSDQVQRSTLLSTTALLWAEFAESAPKVRLDRLAFAMSDDGRVLVRGEPLPSLPGQQYWETDGNVIPVGWASSPSLDGPTLSKSLGRDDDEFLLLRDDGSVESIPKSSFVQASRAAVRSSIGSASP